MSIARLLDVSYVFIQYFLIFQILLVTHGLDITTPPLVLVCQLATRDSLHLF